MEAESAENADLESAIPDDAGFAQDADPNVIDGDADCTTEWGPGTHPDAFGELGGE